jgi:hypothetical protein
LAKPPTSATAMKTRSSWKRSICYSDKWNRVFRNSTILPLDVANHLSGNRLGHTG